MSTQTEPRRMLRLKEVAVLLACHEDTVLRLIRSGELRSVKFGGKAKARHRFDPREIERFMASGQCDERPE